MNSIVITYDESFKQASVYDTYSDCINHFEWDENFNIVDEQPSSDCEDFNDNARWLIKTLLTILKMEKDDDMAHCDWSADYDRNKDTGKQSTTKIPKRLCFGKAHKDEVCLYIDELIRFGAKIGTFIPSPTNELYQ